MTTTNITASQIAARQRQAAAAGITRYDSQFSAGNQARDDNAMTQCDASPVESALNNLSAQVEAATMQMNELAQRLIFVSDSGASGSETAGNESPAASVIENRIENITRQVSRIANQLADMRAALRI